MADGDSKTNKPPATIGELVRAAPLDPAARERGSDAGTAPEPEFLRKLPYFRVTADPAVTPAQAEDGIIRGVRTLEEALRRTRRRIEIATGRRFIKE